MFLVCVGKCRHVLLAPHVKKNKRKIEKRKIKFEMLFFSMGAWQYVKLSKMAACLMKVQIPISTCCAIIFYGSTVFFLMNVVYVGIVSILTCNIFFSVAVSCVENFCGSMFLVLFSVDQIHNMVKREILSLNLGKLCYILLRWMFALVMRIFCI